MVSDTDFNVVVQVFGLLFLTLGIMGIMLWPFYWLIKAGKGGRYNPNLIDVGEYMAQISEQKRRGIPMMPPPPPPSGDWNDKEMEAMRKNRESLKWVYEQMKGGRR